MKILSMQSQKSVHFKIFHINMDQNLMGWNQFYRSAILIRKRT